MERDNESSGNGNICFRSPASYLCMTILGTLAFPFFVFFIVVTCNTATTIPIEPLSEIPAGATTRFIFPTSGSNDEAYLTRPAGPGPFPLRSCFTGTRLDRWAAPTASCLRRKPLPAIFAMRVWPFRFQAMAPQKRHRGQIQRSPW